MERQILKRGSGARGVLLTTSLRIKNFEARNGNFEKNAVVKNQGTKQRVQRILGDCWQWEFNGQCSKGVNCSFRHDMNKRAKMTQLNPSPNSFMQQNERNAWRTRSPRGMSPSGRTSRWPCKDYCGGTCNNSFCEKCHPPECLFYKTKSGCQLGEKCSYVHRQVESQPSKRSKTNDHKSAVAMLKKNDLHESIRQPVVNRDKSHDRPGRPDVKRDTCHELKQGPVGRRSSNTRQLGFVFQDMKPPKPFLRKSSDMQKPIQRVKFTKALARHSYIRDQNPSLGYICPGSAAPTLQNLRIGLRRRRNGKSDVPVKQRGSWPNISSKLKEKHETAFSHLRKIGAYLHQLLN